MKVIVVGAGIIGALTAFRLSEAGAEVTLMDAAGPAHGASGASFGWINASFYLNRDHFDVRLAAIEAHRRLATRLSSRAHQWTGCLCWEEQGAALDRQHSALAELGYTVQMVDRAEINRLEPAVVAPERALRFAQEGAVDLPMLAQDAIAAAQALTAKLISGVAVTGLVTEQGRVTGVRHAGGSIGADRVVVAAGVGTQKLLADVDVPLPLVHRPGAILKTAQMPPLVSHILVSPGQELRQLPDGRFLAPTAAGHQSDTSDPMGGDLAGLAQDTTRRVSALLDREVTWTDVCLAARPVPKDGLPAIGACGPDGLYVAVMHSGATLAPLAAECIAAEVLEKDHSNVQSALMAPYRPQRFTV